MFGLRRWHLDFLASEAVAGLIVIWAYRDIVDHRNEFLGGLAGWILLFPGLRLLGVSPDPNYPAVCLVTAAIYTAAIFGLVTISRWISSRLIRWASEFDSGRLLKVDSDRYLR